MQFDRSMMKRLLSEGDDALWQAVRAAAEENGISLPPGQPSARDMARLRAILAGKGPEDVASAMDVLRRARGEK